MQESFICAQTIPEPCLSIDENNLIAKSVVLPKGLSTSALVGSQDRYCSSGKPSTLSRLSNFTYCFKFYISVDACPPYARTNRSYSAPFVSYVRGCSPNKGRT